MYNGLDNDPDGYVDCSDEDCSLPDPDCEPLSQECSPLLNDGMKCEIKGVLRCKEKSFACAYCELPDVDPQI